MAIELALQLGVNQRDCSCRAGGGRDQRQARCACPPQIFVRCIDDGLGVGLVVDGCDDPVLNADLFMQNLDDRGQAVGCTGGGRQQMVLLRVIKMVVDPHDDIQGA